MKRIKTSMYLLLGGLFATTLLFTVSCSKDGGGTPTTPAPTVVSFAPITGLVGATVTISGTNLTGATVKFNGTTAVTSAVTATSITCVVPAGATTGTISVTTAGGTATSVTTFTVLAAPSSDDVASANLIAKWTFNDTRIETKSSLAPTTTSGTLAYVTGKIGKAQQFTNATLIYPTMSQFNSQTALASGFSLSLWAQIPSNTTNYTPLWQLNGNIGDIFGLVGLAFRKNGDILDFNGCLTHVNGTGTHSTSFAAHLEGAATTFSFGSAEWAFITMTYDDATRKIVYYGNGAKIGEKSVDITVIPAAEQFELVTTLSNPGVSISQVSFGSLNTNPPFATGPAPAAWQNSSFTGILDDVRVFNKALSTTEITDLYTRGSAGN